MFQGHIWALQPLRPEMGNSHLFSDLLEALAGAHVSSQLSASRAWAPGDSLTWPGRDTSISLLRKSTFSSTCHDTHFPDSEGLYRILHKLAMTCPPAQLLGEWTDCHRGRQGI